MLITLEDWWLRAASGAPPADEADDVPDCKVRIRMSRACLRLKESCRRLKEPFLVALAESMMVAYCFLFDQ